MGVEPHRLPTAEPRSVTGRRVAVLMAVRNGERFLAVQIASILSQRMDEIDLWISDDGSEDGTDAIVERVARDWAKGSVHRFHGPRRGFAENYRALMTQRDIDADYVAFCDQDDDWEEDKLSTAIAWLERQPPGLPCLYCSRTRIINEDGESTGTSPLFPRQPSFRNALVQSIAGGNTMVMNRAAHVAVREASSRTSFVSHDWWCYQIVTGVGGTVHYSPDPKIGYRQHSGNLVGENNSWRARIFRLRSMAQGRFQRWNERNIAALCACRDMLTPEATRVVELFQGARKGPFWSRLIALRRSGVYRQTFLGHAGLYLACIVGKL